MNKLKDRFNFENISIVNKNITDYDCPADVVFALTLIHWIYSCTSALGSLNAAVSFLKKLTKESLFVEWIDPGDTTIEFFKHTKYNRNFIKEPYNKENFISALKNNFTKVEKIADIIPTRQLYLAVV
jgi:transposase-like protein